MRCTEALPNIIQLLSFPIEIFGFFLTFTELFFSQIADRIEASIDWLGEVLKNLSLGFFRWSVMASKGLIGYFGGLFIQLVIGCILAIISQELGCKINPPLSVDRNPYVTREEWYEASENAEPLENLLVVLFHFSTIIIFFISICIGFYLIIKIISGLIFFLNKITNGKALGSIGLIFALIGLSGETVQVVIMDICDQIIIHHYWNWTGALIICLLFIFLFHKLCFTDPRKEFR